MPELLRELPGPNMGTVHTPRITSTALLLVGQAKVDIWPALSAAHRLAFKHPT